MRKSKKMGLMLLTAAVLTPAIVLSILSKYANAAYLQNKCIYTLTAAWSSGQAPPKFAINSTFCFSCTPNCPPHTDKFKRADGSTVWYSYAPQNTDCDECTPNVILTK